MTPFEVGMAMMQAGLQMRALADWMMVNHERISPATELFIGCYLAALARYATVTMTAIDNPRSTVGRMFF